MIRQAFTLIELLVVITIIVVLLSLLTPALDRAVYQAELAVCGARLKGIATAVQVYAADNKRRYPERMAGSPGSLSPHQILGRVGTTTAATWNADCRVALRPLLSINKSLNDPLCHAVNLDNQSQMENVIYTSTQLWFGYQYTHDFSSAPHGMFRMGDRWTWRGPSGLKDELFDVLASDIVGADTGWGYNSHPDYDGVWTPAYGESIPSPWLGNAPVTVTYSWWADGGNMQRGPVDANYAMQDGSVQRITAIKWNTNPQLPELAEDVPMFGDGYNQNSTWWLKVPMSN